MVVHIDASNFNLKYNIYTALRIKLDSSGNISPLVIEHFTSSADDLEALITML